jgi:hypothetical protein
MNLLQERIDPFWVKQTEKVIASALMIIKDKVN